MEVDMLARRRYPAFGGRCYRHSAQVYVAESNNTQRELQESLRALPVVEQTKVSGIWRDFASETAERRLLILQGIVNLCCIPQLSYLNKVVPQQLRVDFMAAAPPDVSLKILSYLDAKSLCQAAQVSRTWAALANDDILWHRMCAQHIDKVCKKCGWGLPLLDRSSRRMYEATARRALRLASSHGENGEMGTVTRQQQQQLQSNGDEAMGTAQSAGQPYSFALPIANVTVERARATDSVQQRQMIPVSSLINSSDMDVSLISSVCSPQNTVPFMQSLPQQGHGPESAGPSIPGSLQNVSHYLRDKRAESGNLSDSSSGNDAAGNSAAKDGQGAAAAQRPRRRPWKAIFAERQVIANNWRRFRYHESQVQAHADGIL
ncbi:hypothetical protein GGI10_004645, partial [Coemansia sp. RSA 2530]